MVRGRRNNVCSMPSLPSVEHAWLTARGVSVPTRRMYWRMSAPSTAWSVLGNPPPCAQPFGHGRPGVAPEPLSAGVGSAAAPGRYPLAHQSRGPSCVRPGNRRGRLRPLDRTLCPQAPGWLREEPAVETLRRVWVQQFYREDGCVRWRTEHEGIPPARLFISSPMTLRRGMPRSIRRRGSAIKSMSPRPVRTMCRT